MPAPNNMPHAPAHVIMYCVERKQGTITELEVLSILVHMFDFLTAFLLQSFYSRGLPSRELHPRATEKAVPPRERHRREGSTFVREAPPRR